MSEPIWQSSWDGEAERAGKIGRGTQRYLGNGWEGVLGVQWESDLTAAPSL
jgi:hypothetical protein